MSPKKKQGTSPKRCALFRKGPAPRGSGHYWWDSSDPTSGNPSAGHRGESAPSTSRRMRAAVSSSSCLPLWASAHAKSDANVFNSGSLLGPGAAITSGRSPCSAYTDSRPDLLFGTPALCHDAYSTSTSYAKTKIRRRKFGKNDYLLKSNALEMEEFSFSGEKKRYFMGEGQFFDENSNLKTQCGTNCQITHREDVPRGFGDPPRLKSQIGKNEPGKTFNDQRRE